MFETPLKNQKIPQNSIYPIVVPVENRSPYRWNTWKKSWNSWIPSPVRSLRSTMHYRESNAQSFRVERASALIRSFHRGPWKVYSRSRSRIRSPVVARYKWRRVTTSPFRRGSQSRLLFTLSLSRSHSSLATFRRERTHIQETPSGSETQSLSLSLSLCVDATTLISVMKYTGSWFQPGPLLVLACDSLPRVNPRMCTASKVFRPRPFLSLSFTEKIMRPSMQYKLGLLFFWKFIMVELLIDPAFVDWTAPLDGGI